jgi:histidyl-tRNA synthetase
MKPSIPQGTRDFGPDVLQKRYYILNTIRSVFERYGFLPLETPAFENLDTLMGKYGDEGDKLIFKILNNGLDLPEKHEKARADFQNVLEGKNVKGITERALKYDLTIPFARYVAMNKGQLQFPFKRYQIQPVWRADRPQRGRYREFTQCDADIVGSKSLLNEIDLIQIYLDVFQLLHMKVLVCLNHRNILAGLAVLCGGADQMSAITVAIDKLDKIGIEKVQDELRTRGLSDEAITTITSYLSLAMQDLTNMEILAQLKLMFANVPIAMQGISDIEYLLANSGEIVIDVTLARGLNYYTGAILEVKPLGIQMGSIGGGGRYDDLTGLFGVPDLPGVGISFGVDRIYDVMDELNLFPATLSNPVSLMLINFGATFDQRNLELLRFFRSKGIACELYPDAVKFDKQLKYASKRLMPFIGMIGENEAKEGLISIKNFTTGEQQTVTPEEAADIVNATKN